MQSDRLSVFIGSSKEGLGIAQAIQLELEEDAVCTIWYQGVFGLSNGTLESLENALPRFHFAILVLTPDDVAIVRGKEVQLPRDNVLFELGLFMGHLGRKRVFVVYCNGESTKLPSDLAGINVGTVRVPGTNKPLHQHSTTELLPILGPVVSKIRSAIKEVQQTQLIETRVYYIAPTMAHNEYYARLQTRLEAELAKLRNVSWQFCPTQGDTPHDLYMELETLLKIIRSHDVIILVPKDLHNSRNIDLVEKILEHNSQGRIIFIDQPPPKQFLELERVSFVGIDNRKVGILAAFALFEKLSQADQYMYCAISGPGGDSRVQGFVEGVKFLDPDSDLEIFKLGDVDRIESLPYITQIIQSCPPEISLGVFSGNDETAIAVLQALEDKKSGNVFVVGTDATREMRLAVDRKQSAAVATIDTNLYDQAQKIVQCIKAKGIEYQEPKLYPINLRFRKLLKDQKFMTFWGSE